MSQSPPVSPFFQTAAPTHRQEDLLLNSHILAYESLVGTLTKQVMAQQEQLSELRSVILSTSGPANTSSIGNISQTYTAPAFHSAGLVASPIGPRHTMSKVQEDDLLQRLEPLICQSLAEHFYNAEERIAASLADRIRRITKEHVMRSVDREIRRVMRDAVVESCAKRVLKTTMPTHPERVERHSVADDDASSAVGGATKAKRETGLESKGRLRSSTKKVRSGSEDVWQRGNHQRDDRSYMLSQVRERQRLVESVEQKRHNRSSQMSTQRQDAQFEEGRKSENRLLFEMDKLRTKLEELERRSGGASTDSRRDVRHISRSEATGQHHSSTITAAANLPPHRKSTHHDSQRSSASSSSIARSASSSSAESAPRKYPGSHEPQSVNSSQQHVGDNSLHHVDRDVDYLMQAFRDLSRSS